MSDFQDKLRITEIFHSLQGESVTVGLPTVFIRLTGCPLRCQYCDTAYAFNGGKMMPIADIVEQAAAFACHHICVTGGEPLAQPGCWELLKQLCDAGHAVSIETSGARSIEGVDERVMIVMDLKTPGSGEVDKNKLTNLDFLKPSDQIKFVLCHREDYQWATKMVNDHQLARRFQVLFSPSFGQLNPTALADWIIEDRIPVRFQLQLHKLLWNDAPGH
jgi:7-carboxy-7-deazaguanine synthase